jgi:hypothetical protein
MPQTLEFKSRVGQIPTFFLAATGDEPTAMMVGPSGEFALDVTTAPTHDELGERWQVTVPEAFWVMGEYEIVWSTGDVYSITVQKHPGAMRPAEAARFSRLSYKDQIMALALAAASRGEEV